MIDLTRTMCNCNDRTAGEVVEFIKAHSITDLDTLVEQDEMPVGDVCESCRVDGFDDDGFSLTMLLEEIEKGPL